MLAMGCYLALRIEGILIFVMKWMEIDDIIVNEISQSQKGKYLLSPLARASKNSQIHRHKNRMAFSREWNRGVTIQWLQHFSHARVSVRDCTAKGRVTSIPM